MKYSKSGVILPIINPDNEYHFFGKYVKGRTSAGCEKVNGILYFLDGTSLHSIFEIV
ncbi:MAG: hypothetical protein LLG13_02180 [Bacteroidales bacterium]|nr:hypothetical protein [Bacteroidales bacterium]